MAQTDKSRVCTFCQHPLKDEEKRCSRCFPNAPTLKALERPKPRTEDWYCATCATKVPKTFQTCPVCAKTHIVCRRCKKVVLPALANLYVCQECYDLLQTQKKAHHSSLEKNEEEAKEPPDMIEEYLDGKSLEDAEAEQDFEEAVVNVARENRQAPAVPYTPLIGGKSVQEAAKLETEQDGRGGARPNAGRPRKDAGRTPLTENNHNTGKQPDGRRQPWTEERKKKQADLVREGKIGRKHKQKQTEAKKDALKKTQATSKVDGRKTWRQDRANEKPETPPMPVEPLTIINQPIILKSRYGEFIATDAASMQILKQIIAIVEHDLQSAKGAPQ